MAVVMLLICRTAVSVPTYPTTATVQGRSRSSTLVPPESASSVLVMISCSTGNCSHARRANKSRSIFRGTPVNAVVRGGISSPSGTKFAQNKLDTLRYHMIKTRSLYLTWAWVGAGSWRMQGRTDRRTDRQNYDSWSRVKTKLHFKLVDMHKIAKFACRNTGAVNDYTHGCFFLTPCSPCVLKNKTSKRTRNVELMLKRRATGSV